MSAKLRNPKVLAGVVLGGVVLDRGGRLDRCWSGPSGRRSASSTAQIPSVQTQIDQRKAALATPKVERARSRQRRLPPDAGDARRQPTCPGSSSSSTGSPAGTQLKFVSIQPGALVAQTGFNVQPLTVVVQGGFGDVSRFLGDLRKLVRVKKHKLAATGRLFAVDSVDFATPESPAKFPTVKATLAVDAFTFAGGVLPTTDPVHVHSVRGERDGCSRSEPVMATKVDPASPSSASRR